MKIRYTITEKDNVELDQFLWEVLWEPFGFDRDVRKLFNLDSPHIDLMAFDDGILIGGLVAYFISDTEVEIRHIAVRDNMRGNAVGRSLVERLISLLSSKSANKITVNARSTSEGFYAKLGFVLVGERFEHHLFTKYGISIQPMYLKL